jgi:hypothetical protein
VTAEYFLLFVIDFQGALSARIQELDAYGPTVPEPGAALLLAAVLGALGGFARSRTR